MRTSHRSRVLGVLLALKAAVVVGLFALLFVELRSDPAPERASGSRGARPGEAKRAPLDSPAGPTDGMPPELPWQASAEASPPPPDGQVAAWELDPPAPGAIAVPTVREPEAYPDGP
jgi:hypothetical protein